MRRERRDEFLQWFGLLGAPAAWILSFIFGAGAAIAGCSTLSTQRPLEIGTNFRFDASLWELIATAIAAFVAVLSEAAAFYLFRELRDQDNTPPGGRRVFFVYAAVPANLIFIGIILMQGLMSAHHFPCQQA
jgi:uncharacterized membrane protein